MHKQQKKRTPNYHHVCDKNKPFRGKVYEPEADSFLFLDALDADKEFLQKLISSSSSPNFSTVLEIGVGSGIVCSHCCFHCLSPDVGSSNLKGLQCIGVDINKSALMATRETWEATRADRLKSCCVLIPDLDDDDDDEEEATSDGAQETRSEKGKSTHEYSNETSSAKAAAAAAATYFKNLHLNLLHSSGLSAIRSGSVDLLLFNPPYVPTSTEEMLEAQATALSAADELPAAWAGGLGGREVCDAILPRVPEVLTYPHGVAYIVALKENNIDDMLRVVNEEGAERLGRKMKATVVALRWTGEHLRVVRFEFCA